MQDGEDVEGRGGGRHHPCGSVERGSKWEEGLGLRLIIENRLHAVVRHRHQVRLLLRHGLEYGGASEVDWDFDCFKGGDGGEEGAGVCYQLGLLGALVHRGTSSCEQAATKDAKQDVLRKKKLSLRKLLELLTCKRAPSCPGSLSASRPRLPTARVGVFVTRAVIFSTLYTV